MTSFERYGDLEIAYHDLRFQRRSWVAERAGHVVLAIIVVLALAGLFAGGPLSDAVARDPRSGMAVSYERFLRLGRVDAVVIDLGARAGREPVKVSLTASYLEHLEPQSIIPEPESQTATGDTVTYSFEPGTRRLSLHLEPSAIGPVHGRVSAGGVVEFEQIVWP